MGRSSNGNGGSGDDGGEYLGRSQGKYIAANVGWHRVVGETSYGNCGRWGRGMDMASRLGM